MPGAARAEVRLGVGGAAQAVEDGFAVRLDVANTGETAATRVDVEAELFGHHAEGSLGALDPGATRSLELSFPVEPPRPGVHALSLHLRYPAAAAGTEPVSQRAYLLLALGAPAESPLRMAVRAAPFGTRGSLTVALESADGRAHRARLRVLAPRGLNALAEPELDVPARGPAAAEVPLLRVGPSRHARHGVVVLAAAEVDGRETTAAATAAVDLVLERPWLPRLRGPLAGAGSLLLAAAVGVELWRRLLRASRPEPTPPPGRDGSSPAAEPE